MQNQTSGRAAPVLVAFHKRETLNSARQAMLPWENDRDRLGVGTVALGFDGIYWLVLVSQDLIDIALPF